MSSTTPPSDPRVVIPIVAGVGNALMAVPLVRQLKLGLPRARITVIARIDAMGEPFRRMKEVEEVLITGNGVRGLLRKVISTRTRKPDVYLVPFPSNRWQYNLLAALSGARRRIMHSFPIARWRALGFVRADRVPAVRGIHDVRQNIQLLSALGIEPNRFDRPIFNLTESDRRRGDSMLRSLRIDEQTSFLAIHAGSGRTILGQAKRWPIEKYARLIAMLREEIGQRVVLIEGPDEAGVADEILRACADRSAEISTLRLTGPLGDAAAVLARAQLYIGSDSGLAHLAAAVGTPAVTIFAPADPDRVCPFGYRDLVVKPDKSCSPCFQYPWKTPYPKLLCREPMCVGEVPVDAVMSAVRNAMNKLRVLVTGGER